MARRVSLTLASAFAGRAATLAALATGIVLASYPMPAAGVVLSDGEPDANCPELRLWLRADAGVRDAAGRGPADPAFSGSVAEWTDQSGRHFDLTAPPGQAPQYVASGPAAGGRPMLTFGNGWMLTRANDALHEQVNSTTFLVLRIQRGRNQGNGVFCAGDLGGKRVALCFEGASDASLDSGFVRWWFTTLSGVVHIDAPLRFAADGRFAVVVLHSAGDKSFIEVQDGLGDVMGANRAMIPAAQSPASNQCGRGYCLGGLKLDQPQSAYDGEIAEVMVYDRALSSAQRRALFSYLRRKYELDVLDALYPADTMLLQVADFDGPWQFVPRQDPVSKTWYGHSIQRTILIPRPGNYSVWLFGLDFDLGKQAGLQTSVGGKPLAVTHVRGPRIPNWQLVGTVDLPAGETEIAVRAEGPGRKECDTLLVSPTVTTIAGVEEICALARRLRQTPSPSKLAAVFDDGRRIEGSVAQGWRGSGVSITRGHGARPAVRCLLLDDLTAEKAPPSDAILEFHNGDRIRGSVCGYTAAATEPGQGGGPQLLALPSQGITGSSDKPIAIDIDWLRRIIFDPSGPRRNCPPRSLVCRDGRVFVFRALRFNGEGISALTDHGLVRLAYRDLAEVAMQPLDPWEAYYRQLAAIDPDVDADLLRLETTQGTVLTASTARVRQLRGVWESAAATCLVQPAWSRTPIPVAWSAVRMLWRAPATVVPLSLFAPQAVVQRGLGSSWKWQVNRSVAGGELRSSGAAYLWGFGVHAPNALFFRLPDVVQSFRSGLGIDAAVGSGCVVGKVYLNEASGAPLFQSKPLRGSQSAVSTGEIALPPSASAARQLVLAVDDGDVREPGDAPLDIGDHADWLEATLVLDPARLRAAVEKNRPRAPRDPP